MASPRDYRKPRNNEMRDLLLLLPSPVKVVDGTGQLLWQNQAAERLEEQPEWLESSTTWQGRKATLCMPAAVEVVNPHLAELEAENERLRKHQRQTARRKKQAESSAKQTEKAAGEFEKREQKLRQQLEAAEGRVSELELSIERSRESSLEGLDLSFEGSVETSVEVLEPSEGKGKGKRKKGKDKGKAARAADLSVEDASPVVASVEPSREALSPEFEQQLRQLEQAHEELCRDLAALQAAEARWQEDQKELARQRARAEAAEAQQAGLQTELQTALEKLAAREQELREARQEEEARNAELNELLEAAESRHAELKAQIESLGRQRERVRELEELERSFEEQQRDLLAQKQELEQHLGEQEREMTALRESMQAAVNASKEMAQIDPRELTELREDLAEAKQALLESNRRELRLSEKLEAAGDLKDEQAKVLALIKDELNGLRSGEKELRDTIKLYEGFRDQARADAKKYKLEAEEAREASEKLEARLLESRRELAEARSGGGASKGLSLRESSTGSVSGSSGAASASSSGEVNSPTLKNQLEFAQSRLRDTEKQLDETRAALKKAQGDAVSAKDTEKLAFQDTLTGLPNRHIVDRYLDFSHKQARSTGRAYSLFLIDIDGFRVLNETFGREWGDALLKAVAERLAGMRGANHIFARHSQDRFLLLAADLAKPGIEKFVDEAARSLLGALSHPFEVKGEPIKLTGSIGVVLGPGLAEEPRDTFNQAEAALASAKARGIGSYFVHNEALGQKAQRDATYQRQMTHAIERDEFVAVYQPIFNLNKGMVTGLELLLRWNHRDQRQLKPEDFLEVAVRSGLILSIADSIWPKAFAALGRWRRLRPGVTLGINLSDRELLSPGLVERATGMAKKAGIEPSAVLFEVRDASHLRFSGAWWSVLGALHGAGFGLVLDDYGSEASLFGTLAYSGFQQAKMVIDEKNPVCTPAPNAAKGVAYVAKRVQTRFDPKALKKAGFDMAQGSAVARPIDEADVDGVLGR